MAHQIIELIAQYGLLLVFLNVLVEQAGVPVPAVPTMIVAGALSANGKLPLAGVVLAALVACLLSDLLWYWAGRRFGAGVMRTICRISLSPDSCVKQSELRFQRWRGRVLLIAKFVPGLSTVAPPLVGAMGLRAGSFVLLDGLGSLLWVGVAVGLGESVASGVGEGVAVGAADSLDAPAVGVSVAAIVGVTEGASARLPSPRTPFRPKAIPPPTMIAPKITAAATAARRGECVTYAHGDVRRGPGPWAVTDPPPQTGLVAVRRAGRLAR